MPTLNTPSTRARGPMYADMRRPYKLSGIGQLGACDPLDTACVEREFEQSVAYNAAQATTLNRQYRANCMNDWTRTAESCYAQYPDVTSATLWQGGAPGGGGAVSYTPVTGSQYINNYVQPNVTAPQYTPPTYTPPVSAPVGASASATFSNVTRPGQQAQVGDQWKVVVTGTPGGAVSASSTKNGISNGSAPMGNLDGNGRLTLTGTFSVGEVGSWTENWYVNGAAAGNFAFNVGAATISTPVTPSTTGGGTGSNATGGASDSSTSSSTSAAGVLDGISTNTLLIGGGILAVVVLMMKK